MYEKFRHVSESKLHLNPFFKPKLKPKLFQLNPAPVWLLESMEEVSWMAEEEVPLATLQTRSSSELLLNSRLHYSAKSSSPPLLRNRRRCRGRHRRMEQVGLFLHWSQPDSQERETRDFLILHRRLHFVIMLDVQMKEEHSSLSCVSSNT